MKDLIWGLVDLARDNPSQSSFDITEHATTLRKLGLEEAFENRPWQSPDPLERDKSGWDWMGVIGELESALYDSDIEKSLHLQAILDLYPLHKRILGLIEYMIIPEIGDQGKASQVFTDAFCRPNGSRFWAGLTSKDGILATLETEGNWLIFAEKETTAGAERLDLACLLDELIEKIVDAHKANGITVTLKPASPREHAEQLRDVSKNPDEGAAKVSLSLGKIALMLRNAIEHGSDRVAGEALEINCSGYWAQPRGGKRSWNGT